MEVWGEGVMAPRGPLGVTPVYYAKYVNWFFQKHPFVKCSF